MKSKLQKLCACPEAIEWVGDRTLQQAFNDCERADWMLWLAARMIGKPGWPTHQQVVLAACVCAESVLDIFEKKYPSDAQPRAAIAAARKWAKKPTKKNAAYAHAAYAAYAADAAADSSFSLLPFAAAHAAHAAHAYAADAAVYAAAAARKEHSQKMAVKIRKILKFDFSVAEIA